MIAQLTHRLRLFVLAVLAIPVAAICLVLFVLSVTGAGLVAVWVGLPMLDLTIMATRFVANIHRRLAGGLLGRTVGSPYRPDPPKGWFAMLRRRGTDPATWRDVAWLLVNGTVGLTLAILGVVETVLDLLFWWLPPSLAMRTYAWVAATLLAPSQRRLLAQRVEQLGTSRAETVDAQAAELRRIERDLHDGAQARLVSLGMSLALAEDLLDRDPAKARSLLVEARTASSAALTELRDLVRGIHPPVLADRGLAGAVQALAFAAPIPVQVDVDVLQRLPAPAESAAYFAVAEALTNVIKHAGATRAAITIRYRDELLGMRVIDDGRGGADASAGTGLRGIERRLSAFDGSLAVSSPVGGPTEVAMVLPCVSSSPKILPSSGTA